MVKLVSINQTDTRTLWFSNVLFFKDICKDQRQKTEPGFFPDCKLVAIMITNFVLWRYLKKVVQKLFF